MRRWWWACGLALVVVGGGCGGRRGGHGGDGDGDGDGDGPAGSSGLDRGDRVGDLSENDAETLCEWSADQQGGAGTTQECEGGFSVTVKSVQECFDSIYEADCEATVGDIEDCMGELAGDPCILIEAIPPECGPLLACGQAQP